MPIIHLIDWHLWTNSGGGRCNMYHLIWAEMPSLIYLYKKADVKLWCNCCWEVGFSALAVSFPLVRTLESIDWDNSCTCYFLVVGYALNIEQFLELSCVCTWFRGACGSLFISYILCLGMIYMSIFRRNKFIRSKATQSRSSNNAICSMFIYSKDGA